MLDSKTSPKGYIDPARNIYVSCHGRIYSKHYPLLVNISDKDIKKSLENGDLREINYVPSFAKSLFLNRIREEMKTYCASTNSSIETKALCEIITILSEHNGIIIQQLDLSLIS